MNAVSKELSSFGAGREFVRLDRLAGAEWQKSTWRELLDHVIVLNESHLHRLVRDYIRCYYEGPAYVKSASSDRDQNLDCRGDQGLCRGFIGLAGTVQTTLEVNPFAASYFTRDPEQNGSWPVREGQSILLHYRVRIRHGDYRHAQVLTAYERYAHEERWCDQEGI